MINKFLRFGLKHYSREILLNSQLGNVRPGEVLEYTFVSVFIRISRRIRLSSSKAFYCNNKIRQASPTAMGSAVDANRSGCSRAVMKTVRFFDKRTLMCDSSELSSWYTSSLLISLLGIHLYDKWNRQLINHALNGPVFVAVTS